MPALLIDLKTKIQILGRYKIWCLNVYIKQSDSIKIKMVHFFFCRCAHIDMRHSWSVLGLASVTHPEKKIIYG